MDLALASSRAGPPFCRAGAQCLHSPYDPAHEAARWLEPQLPPRPPLYIVLLGPCLDYLGLLLREKYPRARIIALQPAPFFRGKELTKGGSSWYPDSPLSLAAFLDAAIGEDAAAGLLILEWPPAAKAFPEMIGLFRASLRASLDRLAASTATIKVLGRRWFMNACRSFLLVERLFEAPSFEAPTVLAAAGPSLPRSLRALLPHRNRYALVAVASALAACRGAGLEPDLVVSTDGGYWSRPHLYPLLPRAAPLAAPLTALPSSLLWPELGILLLDQGSFVERKLLAYLGGGLRLPPHGTVAGSALRLAAERSSGPIILAGLDLAVDGEREHASPHAFDAMLALGSGRLSPIAERSYARSRAVAPERLGLGAWRGSRSLSTYAAALAEDGRSLGGRLFRLFPSPVELPGFQAIGESSLPGLLADRPRPPPDYRPREVPSPGKRRSWLGLALAAWRSSVRDSATALADGAPTEDAGVQELFMHFDLPDWTALHRALAAAEDPRPAAAALSARTDQALADIERRLLG